MLMKSYLSKTNSTSIYQSSADIFQQVFFLAPILTGLPYAVKMQQVEYD